MTPSNNIQNQLYVTKCTGTLIKLLRTQNIPTSCSYLMQHTPRDRIRQIVGKFFDEGDRMYYRQIDVLAKLGLQPKYQLADRIASTNSHRPRISDRNSEVHRSPPRQSTVDDSVANVAVDEEFVTHVAGSRAIERSVSARQQSRDGDGHYTERPEQASQAVANVAVDEEFVTHVAGSRASERSVSARQQSRDGDGHYAERPEQASQAVANVAVDEEFVTHVAGSRASERSVSARQQSRDEDARVLEEMKRMRASQFDDSKAARPWSTASAKTQRTRCEERAEGKSSQNSYVDDFPQGVSEPSVVKSDHGDVVRKVDARMSLEWGSKARNLISDVSPDGAKNVREKLKETNVTSIYVEQRLFSSSVMSPSALNEVLLHMSKLRGRGITEGLSGCRQRRREQSSSSMHVGGQSQITRGMELVSLLPEKLLSEPRHTRAASPTAKGAKGHATRPVKDPVHLASAIARTLHRNR